MNSVDSGTPAEPLGLLPVRLERERSRGFTELLFIELIVERWHIHIALVELATEFCQLGHIRGATRVAAGTVGESTKPQFHWATFIRIGC